MSHRAPEILCKTPLELRKYSIDFTNDLLTGETISSVSGVTSSRLGGGTSTLEISSVAISGSNVTFWLDKGTHGTREVIQAVIITSGGARKEGEGILKIKA